MGEPHDSAARWARADELYREARTVRQRDPVRLKALAETSLELALAPGADGIGYRAGQANALSMLAYLGASQGDVETTLRRAAQAMSSLDSMEPSPVLGDIYYAMGQARFSQGNISEAAEVLNRALGVARAIGDRSLEAHALDGLSSVHCSMGRWQQALDGHLEALGIQLELGDDLNVAMIRSHMSRDYIGLGQPDAALGSALEALAFAEAREAAHLEMTAADALAAVYLELGDLESACSFAVQSLAVAREQGSWLGEGDSLMTLGRVEFARGHFDGALDAVNGALRFAEQHGRAVLEYECHALLADVYEQQGDAATALAEHRRFHELAESRINAESALRLAYLGMEYQLKTAKKDAEIHRLRSLALTHEVEEHRVAQAHLEVKASVDPLTGLYNRRQLPVLADEIQDALRRGEPVCLMVFDIDRFKEVNDTFGHLAGDQVLVSVARQLIKNSRATDTPCRYGGDEFLVLLAGLDAATGAEAAERLRSAVEATSVQTDVGSIRVTISVGVSAVTGGDVIDLPGLIDRADRALYIAKESGRNRAVVE